MANEPLSTEKRIEFLFFLLLQLSSILAWNEVEAIKKELWAILELPDVPVPQETQLLEVP